MSFDPRIYRRQFWTGSYDALALARMRIAFAVVVLYNLLERLRDFYTFDDGADMVERVICLWLLFCDAGATLSLEARRRRPDYGGITFTGTVSTIVSSPTAAKTPMMASRPSPAEFSSVALA